MSDSEEIKEKVCPFKYEDGSYYDLEGQLVPVSDEKHSLICCQNCDATVLDMNNYYCVLQYIDKGKYRDCVGEEVCLIVKR